MLHAIAAGPCIIIINPLEHLLLEVGGQKKSKKDIHKADIGCSIKSPLHWNGSHISQ